MGRLRLLIGRARGYRRWEFEVDFGDDLDFDLEIHHRFHHVGYRVHLDAENVILIEQRRRSFGQGRVVALVSKENKRV